MSVLGLMLLVVAADPDDGLAKKMLPIYVKEAEAYSLAVESAPKKALELKMEPVFEWSNPVRSGLQQGVVFLWLRDGRPSALGCVFSQPAQLPGRRVFHEFHALDPEKLVVTRPNEFNQWQPQAGFERKELPDAGTLPLEPPPEPLEPAAPPGSLPRKPDRLSLLMLLTQ